MHWASTLALVLCVHVAIVVPSCAQSMEWFTLSTPSSEYGDANFFNSKEINFIVTENSDKRFELLDGFSKAAYSRITPTHLLFTNQFKRETGSSDFYTSDFCKFARYSLEISSLDNRSICMPLAAFATEPRAKNQRRTQCSPHVTQCGVPGWSSYPFLVSNLPSTMCTFYPYEDFSQMQPRRVSMSLKNTSTASKTEYTFTLKFSCVHPDWDNNEYIARLIDVQSCSKTSCDPKAVKGERQRVSPEVRFKINVSKRPGWKLEIQSGQSRFAASSSSLGSDGSIPTLVTTRNSDGTTAERRGLPIVPKATYSTWLPNAASFLKDTSVQPFFFESTRFEFRARIDSSFWRHDENFLGGSASQFFGDLVLECPNGFDPDSTNKRCRPSNYNMTSSERGWTFYPARMLPDFAINIAGDNQSIMFFDAATCASVNKNIDVATTAGEHIQDPLFVNLVLVVLAIIFIYALSSYYQRKLSAALSQYQDGEASNPFRRFLKAVYMSTDEFVDLAGGDALNYLRFIKFCIAMSFLIFFCSCVCLPFYFESFGSNGKFGEDGVYNIFAQTGKKDLTDIFMGMTVYNVVASLEVSTYPLTAFFGLSMMIVVCCFLIYRGLHDEKVTLDINIARNVREQSVSMRTIFLKVLVEDYRKLKSDAKFKQLLLQHIGPLRDQLLEAHLVFFQDDLVRITQKRDEIIEKLRGVGQFDSSSTRLTESGLNADSAAQHSESEPSLTKADKLHAELMKFNSEIVSRQKIHRSCTGSAFVTFRSTEAALTFLHNHVTNHGLGASFSRQGNVDNCEKIALNGIFAPEPSDIRWQYVGTTTGTRRLYQFRNYVLFIFFMCIAIFIGYFSILFQFLTFPKLITPLVITADFKIDANSAVSNLQYGTISTSISVLAGILMTIASRILPGLVILIGNGYPTVSNRDNVTNNYWRILLVLWIVYCVLPIIALYSFRWFFVIESCPNEWQNSTRVVFTFKMLLSFCTLSIVLDYLALDLKLERILKLRQKYRAKSDAAKAAGETALPVPSFLELLPIVLITEDRSQAFEELMSYSINSVVFIMNFTVSFFYPQCSVLALLYFILKFYLDKYQLVFLFKPTSRSDGTLLRYIFALLSLFCALSIVCITYIIGIYDLDAVQGDFGIFKDTDLAGSAISFPVLSIVSGIILFLVALSSILPFIPAWVPTSVKNVRYAQIVAKYLQGEYQKGAMHGDLEDSMGPALEGAAAVDATNFEDDFGKYASPYLISHLTTTAL